MRFIPLIRVENNSADGPIDAEGRQVGEEEDPVVRSDLSCEHQGDTPTCPERSEPRRAEERAPGRKDKIKLLKASEARLDADLGGILEGSLRGGVEARLNLFEEIHYQECKVRFGIITTKKTTAPRQKGRRERAIKQLEHR